MRRFSKRKKVNVIYAFLIIDLFAIFAIFNISHASYTAEAIGDASMDVALYAFRLESDNQVKEINLGSFDPGQEKTYIFKVYNTNKKGITSDTDIIYNLKIITTTNIKLEYSLTMAGSSENLIESPENYEGTDAWGTTYNFFLGPEKCFKHGSEKFDSYTLKIKFPDNSALYQDLIESIKVQITSKQALPEDIQALGGVCR